MPWREAGQMWVCVWTEEVRAEGEEEGEMETAVSSFRTDEELRFFILEQIWEKVSVNEDNMAPASAREIRETIQTGDVQKAIDLWLEAVDTYFDEPESIVWGTSSILEIEKG
jgi:hypothetical protein